MERKAVIAFLGIGERDFYRLMRAGVLPRGRKRLGYSRLWYSRDDVAWMLWFVKNQSVFEADPEGGEKPVKTKKIGSDTP